VRVACLRLPSTHHSNGCEFFLLQTNSAECKRHARAEAQSVVRCSDLFAALMQHLGELGITYFFGTVATT
jgi:hypothetical protein